MEKKREGDREIFLASGPLYLCCFFTRGGKGTAKVAAGVHKLLLRVLPPCVYKIDRGHEKKALILSVNYKF
jgi:hypothetical protein